MDLLNRGLGHAVGVITFDHSTKKCYWVEDGFSKISHNNYAELFENCGDLLSLKQACEYVMQFGDKLFVTPQKTTVNRHFLPKDHWSSENRLDLSSYVKMVTGWRMVFLK